MTALDLDATEIELLPWETHNPGDLTTDRVNVLCSDADVIVLANIEADVADLIVREHNAALRRAPVSAGKVKAQPRPTFPILGSNGARIDYQLVADHGGQAKENHYQSVERLAQRGGLSWAELHAVLHNQKFAKVDLKQAIAECRAIEARYLSALQPGDGWQGIESAPKDGRTVLLHGLLHYPSIDAGCPVTVMAHWTDYNGGGWVWHGTLAITFTHWMPTPPPPASDTGDA